MTHKARHWLVGLGTQYLESAPFDRSGIPASTMILERKQKNIYMPYSIDFSRFSISSRVLLSLKSLLSIPCSCLETCLVNFDSVGFTRT